MFSFYERELRGFVAKGEHGHLLNALMLHFESFYKGNGKAVSLSLDLEEDLAPGIWPFLVVKSTNDAELLCISGGTPPPVAPYELLCATLEHEGYLYAAHEAHFHLAKVCYFAGDLESAARHLGRSASIGYQQGYLSFLALQSFYIQRSMDKVLAVYPPEYQAEVRELSHWFHDGYQAVARSRSEQHMYAALSAHDLEYIACALEGLTNKEIAAKMGLSTVTVSKHFSSICQKVQVESKKELVEYARRSLFEYAQN